MSQSGSIRVLHVDDAPDFADLASRFVEREDPRITVETATNAREGLDRLADEAFDAIVSDYDMPGLNGLEFLDAVREEDATVPFILFTGKGSEEVASKAISAGVTDYLQKESGTDQYTLLANRVVNAVERTRAEKARQRHLQAIETAQEGISILSEDGEFIYVNEAYAELYSYEPEEMLGKHWELIYREEETDEVYETILPQVEATGYWHGKTTGLRADGSTFTEDHTLAMTEDGELVCTVRNVTEREKREHAIEELHSTSRAFMRAESPEEVAELIVNAGRDILAMPSNGVFFYDAEEDILEAVAWTRWGEELVEEVPIFSPGESLAWEVFETSEAQFYADVSAVPGRYNPDTDIRSEIILPLGDHGVFLIGSPEANSFDETDVSLAQTLAANATTALDRIEQEQALEASEARYRSLTEDVLDTSEVGTFILNDEFEVVWINEAIEEYFGVDRESIVGRDKCQLLKENIADRFEDSAQFAERVLATYDDNTYTEQFECHILAGEDRGERWLEHWSQPIESGLYEGGRIEHYVDISKRKAQQRELQHKNERLEEFASIVSHDLRNPVSIAEGRLELAQEECESEQLDAIDQALSRMRVLIDDLLALARKGEEAIEVELITLADVVGQCWEHVETADATLVTETNSVIRADRSKLKQLFENMIRNAVEHGGDDVTITIGDLPNGFSVEDNGLGIPGNEHDKVFETGYSTAAGGTGFGLSIVHDIVTEHDWEITVMEGNDGGARFEVTGIEVADG